MRAIILLGTVTRSALDDGAPLSKSDAAFLENVTNRAHIDAEIVFCITDPKLYGAKAADIKIGSIRAERDRVLAEIAAACPDIVIAMGPTPVKCLLNKGSSPGVADMRRKAHDMGLGVPVYVEPSLEEMSFKPGMRRWIEIDLMAISLGTATSIIPDTYITLLPGTPEWDVCPHELRDYLYGSLRRGYGLPDVALPDVTISLDTETYPAFNPWHPQARLRMVQISHRQDWAVVVQATPDSCVPKWVADIISDPAIVKVGSNPKFDYRWLRRFGYPLVNMKDTSTAEHVINENSPSNGLKILTLVYHPTLGDYSADMEKMKDERGGMEFITDAEMYDYAGADVDAGIVTFQKQYQIMTKADLARPYEMMMEYYNVLGDMEYNGARICRDTNMRLDAAYTEAIAECRGKLTAEFGAINPNSSDQIIAALKKYVPDINLIVRKRDADGALSNEESAEAKVLRREAHKHPVINTILDYRRYSKLYSVYVKGLREVATEHGKDLYIHPTFKTDRVETYRTSSVDPNGQNIPKNLPSHMAHLNIKDQFISRFPGGVVSEVDESQIELRFGGIHSGDPVVRRLFLSGADLHAQTAALLYGVPLDEITDDVRSEAKTTHFRVYYGGGPSGLARELGISYKEAQALIASFFRTFAGVKTWMDGQKEKAIRDLYVQGLYGLRRRFHEPKNWDTPEGWHILRQAVNAPIQCDAFWTTANGIVGAWKEVKARRMRTVFSLNVHDSLVYDSPADEAADAREIVVRHMENPDTKRWGVDLTIPLVADYKGGPSWGQARKLVLAA